MDYIKTFEIQEPITIESQNFQSHETKILLNGCFDLLQI